MPLLPRPLYDLLARAWTRLSAAWGEASLAQRRSFTALALTMVGSVAHFLVFSTYYIEDSGISFAFARNFAEGEGWVAWAGGERVEGFSNPLWTGLCVLFYWVGVSPFTTAKLLGAVFGAATLPLAWDLTRRCWPERQGGWALFAPLFLAFSSTCAIWNASGLENGLFGFLLALGAWCVLREGEGAWRFPFSALVFLNLALTRPEGVLYAAVAGLVRLVLAVRAGSVMRPIGAWLVVFWVPLLGVELARLEYFGWPFPNTWYAKVEGEDRFKPWSWSTRGWLYIRNYLAAFGLAFLLPLYAVGLAGLRDRRRGLVLGLTAVGAVLYLWNARAGLPPTFDPDWLDTVQRHWDRARIVFTLAAAALLGLATLEGPGAAARGLMLGLGAAGLFFIHYSGADWMTQWRFFSYIAVPNFVLLALGLGRLLDALPEGPWRPWGRSGLRGAAGLAVVVAVGAPNIWNSAWSAPSPETSVSDVKRRVEYMSWVKNRLHIDERITLLDVDMGAHMYFTDWKILDIAGLIDVPMSRHAYQRAFIREYLFEEHRPHFAHVHGGWASKLRITTHPEWKSDYLEIAGYPSGRKAFHIGNHVRRDIFIRPQYEGPPDRLVRYDGGVVLEGWDLPSPEVPVAGVLYAEIWLKVAHKRGNFRLLALLDDGQGHQHTVEVAPGYDWHRPADWKANEHILHRVELPLPESLPPGHYDLGFVLLDSKTGEVLAPDRLSSPSTQVVYGPPPPKPLAEGEPGEAPGEPSPVDPAAPPPRVMAGEILFTRAVQIVPREEAIQLAEADRQLALDLAARGDCEAAWEAWRQARYHLKRNLKYHEDHTPALKGAVAACYTGRATLAPSEEERIQLLLRALAYDHHLDAAQALARPLAQDLDARGDAFAAEEDWQAAYDTWTLALGLDPRLSATRRKAEAARDHRLGLDGKTKESSPARGAPAAKSKDDAEEDAPDEGDAEQAPAEGAEAPDAPKEGAADQGGPAAGRPRPARPPGAAPPRRPVRSPAPSPAPSKAPASPKAPAPPQLP